MMMAGRSKGTPGGDKGWLPLPGRPVSGLASANTTTSGEEFLDGEVEVWESLRSISDVGEGKGSVWACLLLPVLLLSFYHLTPVGFGLSGYTSWNSRSASSAVPFRRA